MNALMHRRQTIRLTLQCSNSHLKDGRTALQYCEGKNFADMEEIQDLLSLDAPPIDMVGVHSRNHATSPQAESMLLFYSYARSYGVWGNLRRKYLL